MMNTKALTVAALIAGFAAISPAIAQTPAPQGGTGSGNATSTLPKDGGQTGMGGTSSGNSSMSKKMHKPAKTGMGRSEAKGSPVVNEKSSATDASSTAAQGGGASPLNTAGQGKK